MQADGANRQALARNAIRSSLAGDLIPKKRRASANIMRGSCVCLGVSGVLERTREFVQDTLDRDVTETPEGAMNGGCWTLISGCQDAKRSAERIGESAAALSPALLTPGPFRTSVWSEKARCQEPPGLVVSMGR